VTAADLKAGEEDRTPDIQLGNGGHTPCFPEGNSSFRSGPSTGPSSLCATSDDFRQLQTMLGVWSIVGTNARLLFWTLLNHLVQKPPVLPEKQEAQPSVLEATPPPPPPASEVSGQDVQAIAVRRVATVEATSTALSTTGSEEGDDGANDDEDKDDDDDDEDAEQPIPTKRSVLGRLNVSFHPEKRKYYVRIYRHGKTHWAGYFDTPEVAAEAAAKLRERLGLPFLPVWLRRPPKAK